MQVWPEYLDENSELPAINANEIIIDAIFGIGLNREPEAWVSSIIKHINSVPAFTLSVDIPSGLFLDRIPEKMDSVVQAEYTLSFQLPKLPFFLPQTAGYVGQWELLDIGLDAEVLHKLSTEYELIGKFELLPYYQYRDKFAHKGKYGHALIIGGSLGKIGAVLMAAKSCLNSGAGLVTVHTPQCGYLSLQTAIPEVMVIPDKQVNVISAIKPTFTPTVIGIGMGMGTDKKTKDAFVTFLRGNTVPLVVDADALNLLASDSDLLGYLPSGSILTPHLGELKRLIGDWQDDFDRIAKVKKFASDNDLIVVVKGAHSMIVSNKKTAINSTGNPGMATAGSGDVLAGMITALYSQGYSAWNAALFGVYLHGLAGDIVAAKQGYEAVTATKIINKIGASFLELLKRPKPQTAKS